MNQTPKTIQIFLPGGDPQGIRIAEITTRILQVIEVPRSLLSQFSQMPESNQVGVYFLFGESDENDEPQVYIGQTGDLGSRLATHNKKKRFLGTGTGDHFSNQQPHANPCTLPGMVLPAGLSKSSTLRRRKRQQRQPAPYAAAFKSRLPGDI